MKKSSRILVFIGALLIIAGNSISLLAQKTSITVPDYCYGYVNAEVGTVSNTGVANPGPYGTSTLQEDQRPASVWFAHGYRWWGYGFPSLGCGLYPEFSFPGIHGIYNTSGFFCGNPPIGFMGSWGGIVIEPENRKIWGLLGAKKVGGPTVKFCTPVPWLPAGQICYPPHDNWGYGASFGYLRKIVVIKSTGTLKKGDPVNIKVRLSENGSSQGEGTITSQGVLMMNRPGNIMEYMRWSDIMDFLSGQVVLQTDLDKQKDSSTVVLAIGDTIKIEAGFNNTVMHDNPATYNEGIGWSGHEPSDLFSGQNYARTDSVRKIIRKYGNSLSYDLFCLTQGAILEPVTEDGPNLDEDKDGISDAREKGALGNDDSFDGNSDGTVDYKQANAASFLTYNNLNYVTLTVPQGTVLSQMKVTDNPSKSDTPADAQFPFGFFDFSIDGLELGEAVTVTLILHNATSVNKYYKYGMTPDNMVPHWYDFTWDGQTGAQINGNIITLHFVDGLRGDEDITVNGSIKEPGGPAIAGTTGIPELIEKFGILVYPNPATENITLRLINILPGDDYLLNVYSNIGGIVQQKTINVCDANEEFVISTAKLPSGIYLITLSGGSYNFKTKFIKLK